MGLITERRRRHPPLHQHVAGRRSGRPLHALVGTELGGESLTKMHPMSFFSADSSPVEHLGTFWSASPRSLPTSRSGPTVQRPQAMGLTSLRCSGKSAGAAYWPGIGTTAYTFIQYSW